MEDCLFPSAPAYRLIVSLACKAKVDPLAVGMDWRFEDTPSGSISPVICTPYSVIAPTLVSALDPALCTPPSFQQSTQHSILHSIQHSALRTLYSVLCPQPSVLIPLHHRILPCDSHRAHLSAFSARTGLFMRQRI